MPPFLMRILRFPGLTARTGSTSSQQTTALQGTTSDLGGNPCRYTKQQPGMIAPKIDRFRIREIAVRGFERMDRRARVRRQFRLRRNQYLLNLDWKFNQHKMANVV